MSLYAVTREAGPAWSEGGIAGQPDMPGHAAFMGALAAEGFVLFAGPLAGSESGRLRALLIVDAESEDDVRGRLASDPWADRLVFAGIEPWTLFVGSPHAQDPEPGRPPHHAGRG